MAGRRSRAPDDIRASIQKSKIPGIRAGAGPHEIFGLPSRTHVECYSLRRAWPPVSGKPSGGRRTNLDQQNGAERDTRGRQGCRRSCFCRSGHPPGHGRVSRNRLLVGRSWRRLVFSLGLREDGGSHPLALLLVASGGSRSGRSGHCPRSQAGCPPRAVRVLTGRRGGPVLGPLNRRRLRRHSSALHRGSLHICCGLLLTEDNGMTRMCR